MLVHFCIGLSTLTKRGQSNAIHQQKKSIKVVANRSIRDKELASLYSKTRKFFKRGTTSYLGLLHTSKKDLTKLNQKPKRIAKYFMSKHLRWQLK